MKKNARFRLFAPLLILAIALPALAYECPLTSDAIREAYFLGTGPKSKEAGFYDPYARRLTIPKTAPPTSFVTIDTPYLQVAEHSRDATNYSSQDAVKDFFDKPAVFRVFVDIYFSPARPKSGASGTSGLSDDVEVKLIQHGKEIASQSSDSWQLTSFRDASTSVESVGEHVQLEYPAEKIDSSRLKIQITTPDGQHAETTFDLAKLN
jgi:hypothetical protein